MDFRSLLTSRVILRVVLSAVLLSASGCSSMGDASGPKRDTYPPRPKGRADASRRPYEEAGSPGQDDFDYPGFYSDGGGLGHNPSYSPYSPYFYPSGDPNATPSGQPTDYVDRDYRSTPSSGNSYSVEPRTRRQYGGNHRTTRDDFIDDSPDEGSLWSSNGQTNYYLTKNKVRGPGDLISLVMEKDLYSEAVHETQRNLAPTEKNREVMDLKDFYRDKLAYLTRGRQPAPGTNPNDVPGTIYPPPTPGSPNAAPVVANNGATAPSPTPSTTAETAGTEKSPEEIERLIPRLSMKDVDITPSLDMKAGDTLSGEILERYPNGNYKVRAMKRVNYKKGAPRVVSVVGIVKASDINEETDSVNSGKLYEHRIDIAH